MTLLEIEQPIGEERAVVEMLAATIHSLDVKRACLETFVEEQAHVGAGGYTCVLFVKTRQEKNRHHADNE